MELHASGCAPCQAKSANEMYRKSGTTLPFSIWLESEKASGKFIPDKNLNDAIMLNASGSDSEDSKIIDKPGTVLGLNKTILIVSGVIIVAAIGYKIYTHYQKRG